MNVRVLILLFSVGITGLSSCNKNNDDVIITVKPALIDVINAGTDTLNFYQNGTRINNSSNLYPFGSFGYLSVKSGLQNYEFKKAGNPNTLNGVQLTLDTSAHYTLFVTGETNDNLFLIKDALISTTTTATDEYIRFVNASPTAGSVDVTIGSTFSYTNLAYKAATPFAKILPDSKPVLSIYKSGGALLIPAGQLLTVTPGNSYTIFIKGAPNGTGNNALGARIVTTHTAQ